MKRFIYFSFILLISTSFIGCFLFTSKEKTFEGEGMSIVLDASFVEFENIHCLNAYTNNNVAVAYNRFSSDSTNNSYTTSEYLESIVNAANYDAALFEYTGDDISFSYAEYYNVVENVEYFYVSFIMKGRNKFYIFDFYCKSKNEDKYRKQFVDWAKTIKIDLD